MSKLAKFCLLLSTLQLAVFVLSAQTLSGTVTNATTNHPAAGRS